MYGAIPSLQLHNCGTALLRWSRRNRRPASSAGSGPSLHRISATSRYRGALIETNSRECLALSALTPHQIEQAVGAANSWFAEKTARINIGSTIRQLSARPFASY